MQKRKAERAEAAAQRESEFHLTAQRNAIGGYIGCDGPGCWALIRSITDMNRAHKIQGV